MTHSPAVYGCCSIFIEQVEYHTAGEISCGKFSAFANGQLYEIVPIPRGKETMLCQLLRLPQKDAGKRLVVVDDAEQSRAGYSTYRRILYRCSGRNRQLLSQGGRHLNSDMLLNRIRMAQQGLIGVHKKLYTLEHLLPSPDPAQFAETAKSAALLSERSTASLRGFLFTTTGGMPEGITNRPLPRRV